MEALTTQNDIYIWITVNGVKTIAFIDSGFCFILYVASAA